MKLILECGDALCCTHEFVINDIEADKDDFGEKYDHDLANAPEWGCGNMRFDPKPWTQEVLDKYHITPDEYEEICEKLTAEMWLKAQDDGFTYRTGDMLYNSYLGFHDDDGKEWGPDAFKTLEEFMSYDDWEQVEIKTISRKEAEELLGCHIVD